MKKLILSLSVCLFLTGCATIAMRSESNVIIYPATCLDTMVMTKCIQEANDPVMVLCIPIILVDYIPSIFTDTVLLPYDVVMYLRN